MEVKQGANIFVLKLIMSMVPEERREEATTGEVCDLVVKPMTAGGEGRSFLDLVGDMMVAGVPMVGGGGGGGGGGGDWSRVQVGERANVFVSHAWGDRFCDVIATVYVSSVFF